MKALIRVGVIAVLTAAAVVLPGCAPHPCAGLVATAKDKAAAKAGYEVERAGRGGVECELSKSGAWVVDD